MPAGLTAEDLDAVVRDATENNHSSWQLLERFLAAPANASRERAIERRLRQAAFPTTATLESFDWSFNAKAIARAPFEELATGEFLTRGDNLALVGMSGLGKSHLIQGIGRCAVGRHRKTLQPSLAVGSLLPIRAERRLIAGVSR